MFWTRNSKREVPYINKLAGVVRKHGSKIQVDKHARAVSNHGF